MPIGNPQSFCKEYLSNKFADKQILCQTKDKPHFSTVNFSMKKGPKDDKN